MEEQSVKNLLFICSRNQWRSPTAEAIWRKHPDFNARSAGTSPRAKKIVGPSDIRWADLIFAMEQKHKNRLVSQFTRMLEHKTIHVLDIPDDYKYMDPELIQELEHLVEPYLQIWCWSSALNKALYWTLSSAFRFARSKLKATENGVGLQNLSWLILGLYVHCKYGQVAVRMGQ